MTTPIKKKTRRDYGGKPGVTTIMGAHLGWKTNALIGWAHKLGREGRSLRERDEAADKGSCVHAMVAGAYTHLGADPFDASEWRSEDILVAEPVAQRVCDLLASRYEVIACERAILSESFGGTIDLVLRDADGRTLIGDLKTGKGVYDEMAVQLGAYAWLWRQECAKSAMANVGALHHVATEGVIIHAPIEGELSEVPIDARTLATGEHIFRKLLEIHEVRAHINIANNARGAVP